MFCNLLNSTEFVWNFKRTFYLSSHQITVANLAGGVLRSELSHEMVNRFEAAEMVQISSLTKFPRIQMVVPTGQLLHAKSFLLVNKHSSLMWNCELREL